MQKTLSLINLPAIYRNALKVKNLLHGAKFYAVVKADAYRHGAEEVANYIEDLVDGFCVAIVEEGIALRVAGIVKPILVLTPPLDCYDVERANAYNLIHTVNSVETARLINGAPCHIKVNTGMNRTGCNPGDLNSVLKEIPKDSLQGVYSHLFAPENEVAAKRQAELFKRAVSAVKAVNPDAVAHLAASGGILRGKNFLFDGARCGILLYGYAPSGFKAEGFEKALKVFARRTQTTRFIGGGVGYNFADKSYSTLATYRCGYADGFMRGVPLGEKTLCMDAFVGYDKGGLLCVMDDADEYAKRCGTIAYEVLTSITHRSERIYER